jgi:hypothetical protein
MITIDIRMAARSAAFCASGVVAAFVMASAPAMAEPLDPAPPLPPDQDATTQAVASDLAPAPAGVPHLSSPENLPPGTTDNPVEPPQGRGLAYLQDLWHAMHTQDVSMNGALLLLTQRPLDAKAVPPPGVPAGPQQPLPAEPAPPTP